MSSQVNKAFTFLSYTWCPTKTYRCKSEAIFNWEYLVFKIGLAQPKVYKHCSNPTHYIKFERHCLKTNSFLKILSPEREN